MIGLYDMAWYPKPFGAGDMHSAGETKVLGRPEVDFASLLVRETAQNSWDARLPGVVPRFELRLRRLDDHVRDVLAWNIFGQRVQGSALDSALRAPLLTGLEVVDRGTRGLGGPARNDAVRTDGDPNDYADFILTVGAPPSDPSGGGSYGFGKTASYMASACSTIVVWSRSRTTDGRMVERFVGSSMGETFHVGDQRFTGRQWWGARDSSEAANGALAFDPVQGTEARRLGEAVFERHFEGDETGTSILILQFSPRNGATEDDAEAEAGLGSRPLFDGDEVGSQGALGLHALGQELARSVVWNLWPKIDTAQPRRWRMDTAVFSEGRAIPLPGAVGSPLLTSLGYCLGAIREVQAGGERSRQSVKVLPTSRYGLTTGHLAVTRVLADTKGDPFSGLADSVALMRHRAELIVKYEPHSGNSMEALKWVGVFKPVADLDPVFSSAEPPAHDSWAHVEGLDKRTRSIVNVTLRGIRDRVRGFLTPQEVSTNTDGLSTGALSSALAGLAGGLTGVTASADPGTRGGGRRKGPPKPHVDVQAIEPLPRDAEDLAAGRQRTVLTLSVAGPDRPWALGIGSLSVAVDGGTMRSEGEVLLDRWEGGRPSGDGVIVTPQEEVRAVVSYPAGVAISFEFRVAAA